ncbi:MAG: carbohydrate ABC transporter permease [Thioalkalivibrio sp.]|nr:carbohydrate ABC transporter permease [Thioalkalivibrio sp.]
MRVQRRIAQVIIHVLLASTALLIVLPLVYAFLLAFQTAREASSIPPTLIPGQVNLDNFQSVFDRLPIMKFLRNSVVYSVTTTIMVLVTSTLAAYATTKIRIPGRNVIVGLFVGSILVPPAVRTIPLYTMVAQWGWVDTWAGLALPLMVTGFGLFFMRQFLLTIPDEVIEAARIDGASELQIVARVVTPLALPGLAVLALYNFMFRWNDYLWPLVMTRDKWTTLPVGIAVFKSSEQLVTWNLIAAAAVVTLLPVLALFFALRSRIMDGIALQAGK